MIDKNLFPEFQEQDGTASSQVAVNTDQFSSDYLPIGIATAGFVSLQNMIHPHEKTIVPDICPVIYFDFTVNNMDKDWQTTYRVTY